ncbi:MAG: aspartyl-tRNA amidotransferase [Parcubacteria group bacterium]|nr:aspartyl-tRNA amidotransferase [Parcubacteria group bacterium]
MLQETIKNDLVAALRAGDEVKKSTLRQLMTALKNEAISLKRDLTEEDELGVVKREVKKLKEGMAEFEKADRSDLADAAKAELQVLEVFMPAQMSDEELESKVKEVIEQVGATTAADMGKVMGVAMKAVGGQADGGRVRNVVQQILS